MKFATLLCSLLLSGVALMASAQNTRRCRRPAVRREWSVSPSPSVRPLSPCPLADVDGTKAHSEHEA
jgi:hypothetical protein